MNKKKEFNPAWTDRAPEIGTYRSIFKWGAPDRFKHPNAGFYALLKDELGVTDADFQKKETRATSRFDAISP